MARITWSALALWFLASLLGGLTGAFNQHGEPPILLGLSIAAPIIGFVTLYAASERFRAFAHSLNLALLVGLNALRVVGFVFLALWLAGELPGEFAIPAGSGDIIAAASAVPLAYLIWKGVHVRRTLVAWNVFGFVDLVNALAFGLLYSNSAFGALSGPITTEATVLFPINMIPTFIVPLYLLIHLLIFARLRKNKNNSSL